MYMALNFLNESNESSEKIDLTTQKTKLILLFSLLLEMVQKNM